MSGEQLQEGVKVAAGALAQAAAAALLPNCRMCTTSGCRRGMPLTSVRRVGLLLGLLSPPARPSLPPRRTRNALHHQPLTVHARPFHKPPQAQDTAGGAMCAWG